MITYLFQYLDTLDIPGAGMFNYISFRAGLTFILALIISALYGRKIINLLQLKQIGEIVRDLGLEGQMSKKGTPTMGGIIIIMAIVIPVLLFARLDNIYIVLMIISTLWLGTVGFIDDYIKVFLKNKEGLEGKFKIFGQVTLGLIVGLTLYLSPDVVIREKVEVISEKTEVTQNDHSNVKSAATYDLNSKNIQYSQEDVKSTITTIPFFKNNNLNYADFFKWAGEHAQAFGWVLFVLITIFIVTAVSNGANLTDGLDGLATGSSAIQGATLGILAYVSGNVNYAEYLNIMYIPGAGELVVFAAAFIGATVGFLWYNAFPAQVFMGDTGSLTLGGIIAVFAIVIHKELLIPILCGVFLVESLSVMMQVSYFKMTKKKYGEGKRIFKMTPLHHHFQKAGNAGIKARIQWPIIPLPESRITIRFWIVGIILAALTIITLKMR